MKPLVHLWICILAAPVILATAYYLDRWTLAALVDPNVWEPGSGLWIQSISRLLLVFLIFATSWMVLSRVPSRLIATGYILVGTCLAFAGPLAISSRASFARLLRAIPMPEGYILYEIAPYSLIALGVAAFVRSYRASKRGKAGSAA